MKLLIYIFSIFTFSYSNATSNTVAMKPVTLKFRVVHGPSSIVAEPLTQFKNEVEKETQSRVQIELITPKTDLESELYAAKEAYLEVKSGQLDMTQVHSFYVGDDVKDFNVLDRPFTFTSHEHAFRTVDGPIGSELFAKLEAKNEVKGLAYTYSGGYRFLATKTKSIQKVEDIVGLEIARRMSPADYILLTALGAKIKRGVKTFGRDGRSTVYSTYLNSSEEKKTPIVNALNYGLQITTIVISQKSLARLTMSDQEILKKAAQKAALFERELAIKAQTEVETNFEKRGLKYFKLSEVEQQKLKAVSDKIDWSDQLGISPGLVERIQNQVKYAHSEK